MTATPKKLSTRAANVLDGAFGRVPETKTELLMLLRERFRDPSGMPREPYLALRLLRSCGRETSSEICGFYGIGAIDDGKHMSPATARYLAREMKKALDDAKSVVVDREQVGYRAWKALVGRVEGWLGERLELDP